MAATHLRITSRRDGFRRAGIAHPARPVEHPIKSFTAEQLAQLKAEPVLVVEEIDSKAEKAEKAEKPAK